MYMLHVNKIWAAVWVFLPLQTFIFLIIISCLRKHQTCVNTPRCQLVMWRICMYRPLQVLLLMCFLLFQTYLV